MDYDPKKIRKLEDQQEKETKLMYKYKSWVFKKQDAIIKIANDLQAEKDKQDIILT